MFIVVLNKEGDGFIILRDFTPESLERINNNHLIEKKEGEKDDPWPFEFTTSPIM